ncbi:MAG TPA: DUF5010 domain-containing protein [Chthoniobacterales bacterium]|nr:DUF5010 domain-containing protein [Chthoniobacterales bacterium]
MKTLPLRRAVLLACGAASFLSPSTRAALPAGDVTLQPVVTDNLPIYLSLSGYSTSESDASGPNKQLPLFYPYDNTYDDWWDNLVAEQMQARLPVIMCATRGSWTTSPTDTTGPGNMNPRRLVALINAFNRAGVSSSLMKVACFVDSPAMQGIFNTVYGYPSTTKLDFANTASWNDIWWLRAIKPWFDTVPSAYWYRINNRPVIQFWGFHPGWSTNHYGNISQMLTFLANTFQSTYGERPLFVMPEDVVTSGNQDATVASQADVLGFNGWFATPSNSYSMVQFGGSYIGCAIAGFIDPGFFDPANSNYNNYNRVVYRNNVSGTGTVGDTFQTGLEAAVTNKPKYTLMEGWTDVEEWAGLYRSLNANWAFPNQYINLVRRYSDLRTVTLKLEAEGADSYYDTTTGNAGGKFRRSGDLDVRDINGGNGWQVGWTAPGEWLEFKDVFFSPGNYKFPIRYACGGANTMRLYVDGVALPDVTVPATGSSDAFDTISLGSKTLTGGTHTLRVYFVTGGVDLDWLFVRKTDPLISLTSASNGKIVTAELGGDSTVIANRTAIGPWEQFSINDGNGGTLNPNDPVTLQTYDGLLLCAEGGGGSTLWANRRASGAWEQFTIVRVSGNGTAIANGNTVAIRSSTGKYLTVGSTGTLDVTGSTIGPAQTFSVTLGTQ